METEIKQKLKVILERDYGDAVDESQQISDQYDLDSLSIIELYLILEDEFGISIPDELRKMKVTLEDLVALIQKQSNAK